MKTIKKYIYVIAAIVIVFQACEREIEYDIISITPPELHVFVENVNGERVANASVSIYDSEEDMVADTGAIVTKTTDQNGLAITTGEELGQTGIFYVSAQGGALAGSGATPFLLLNDGQTRFDVVIE